MLLVGVLLYGFVFAALFREGALTLPGVMKQKPEILWTLKATLVDPFITAALVASGGGVIGLVLGRLSAEQD